MIFQEFAKICLKVLKFDKSFFKDEKNFGQASIYFALVIIILGSIISIIPNSAFLNYMSGSFNLGLIEGPSLKAVIITAIIMWFIKSTYLFFVGVVLFPGKKTKCNYRKILILVAFSKIPLLFNFIILSPSLLFLSVITYIWYNISLIIGINHILKFDSYFKSTIIVLGPIILLFLFFVNQLFNNNSSIIS